MRDFKLTTPSQESRNESHMRFPEMMLKALTLGGIILMMIYYPQFLQILMDK